MNDAAFHRKFSLNGREFRTAIELVDYSKTALPIVFAFLKDWFDTNDHVIVSTSGSTGIPKNIELKKEYMVNSAKATGTFFKLPEGSTALLCLSPDYIAGKMMLVRALVLGWQLDVVHPDRNPLAQLNKHYDFSAMVPMQVFHSLDHLFKIKKLIVGGGRISNNLEQALRIVPTEVFATFGMTETITHIAARSIATKAKLTDEKAYRVLPGVTVSKDDRGCLVIEAPSISASSIRTNDLVELLSPKAFKWLGRFDSIINSGGIKVIPEQIEEKIYPVLANRFFIAGIPDDVLGQRVVLVVEDSKTDDTLLQRLKNETPLSNYELPKEIYVTPNFVETATKKIQRQQTLDLIFKT